jgi:hypothetical protein
MITIEQNPEIVSLVGNFMNYKVSSNLVVETAGQNASVELVKSFAPIEENDTITINYHDKSITFTAKTTPDDSGFQFKYATLADIADGFRSNFVFARDFKITTVLEEAGGPAMGIRIESRIQSELYSMTVDFSEMPGLTLSGGINTPGITLAIRPGFGYLGQVYDSADDLIGEDMFPPNQDRKAVFNIQEYFFTKIAPSFIFPHTSTVCNLKSDMVVSYVAKFADGYGIPMTPRALKSDETRYAIGGAVPYFKQQYFADNETTFWQNLIENKQFLNWCPNGKEVSIDQPEKLYWLATETMGSVILKVKGYTSNGETITKTTTFSTEMYNIYELFVDPVTQGFDGSDLTGYEAWLEHSSTVISEVRGYNVLDSHYNDRYLIFRNSLATYEVIRTTGNLEKKTTYQRDVSEMIFSQEFVDSFRKKQSRILSTEERLNINTGYTDSMEVASWWMELLSSDDVYYWDGSRLVSCIVANEEVVQYNDEEPIYNMMIELILSQTNNGNVGLSGNYYSSLSANNMHTHKWGQISDKPLLFPPSTHGHPWSEVSDKPSTFPSSTHGHTEGEIGMNPRSNLPGNDLSENMDLINQYMSTPQESDSAGSDLYLFSNY